MFFSLRRYLARIYYDLVLAPHGFGRSVDQSVWEEQYRRGDWKKLKGMDEMPHYAVIGGYTWLLKASPAVLDAGCGTGELLSWLNPAFTKYVGIDVSEEAIRQAAASRNARATFFRDDLESWESSLRFDIVIFNESLYYMRDPRATLLRFQKFLEPDGVFLVSMCEYGQNAAVWKRLNEVVKWTHGTTVRNSSGQSWEIRTGRPIGYSQ